MFSWSAVQLLSLKPLVTLLALVNPLASIPFFIHITQGFDAALRKKTIRVTSLSVLVVLVTCALLGLRILAFFGISLAGFQVGGGVLLMMSSINMLNAQPAEAKTSVDEASYAVSHASVAVVPLAIPMLTGPASMSTMVIFADRTQNMLQMIQLLLYAALVSCHGVRQLFIGATHCPFHGPHRHQRHDAVDGTGVGRHERGSHQRRAEADIPEAGRHRLTENRSQHLLRQKNALHKAGH
jgi:multiple antibiotic resistance protein